MDSFKKSFSGLDVLVTGHTGFKGSWLSVWLKELGANVIGYSLPKLPTAPNNFELSNLARKLVDVRGDVRDYEDVYRVIREYKPGLIFHLAAQSIVLRSYECPRETFETNSLGTINILEAVRNTKSVKTVVCITSDKCYERGKDTIHSEDDRLGGHDAYSSSKAMAELAISSYRRSFFSDGNTVVASARAGNVIGGGDFARDRLIPDCIRSLMAKEPILVRNPEHVRPWQFVLEPLSGYLWLSAKLMEYGKPFAEAWNFGPNNPEAVSCEELVKRTIGLWGSGSYTVVKGQTEKRETTALRLDSKKAASRLGWHSAFDINDALGQTIRWYQKYSADLNHEEPIDMYPKCIEDIERYTVKARELGLTWTL